MARLHIMKAPNLFSKECDTAVGTPHGGARRFASGVTPRYDAPIMRIPYIPLLLLLPIDAFGRGGVGGVGDRQLMLGILLVTAVGGILAYIKPDSAKVIGGFCLLLVVLGFAIQLLSFLFG